MFFLYVYNKLQANLDVTDSMGPGKLVRLMQNPSYTYDTDLICMGLGPSISSVMDATASESCPSYLSLPVYIFKLSGTYEIFQIA